MSQTIFKNAMSSSLSRPLFIVQSEYVVQDPGQVPQFRCRGTTVHASLQGNFGRIEPEFQGISAVKYV